jgi:hypothetical protein
MVTSIYADTENLAHPVGWVTLGCLAVQRGDTNRDAVMTALRKQMASLFLLAMQADLGQVLILTCRRPLLLFRGNNYAL